MRYLLGIIGVLLIVCFVAAMNTPRELFYGEGGGRGGGPIGGGRGGGPIGGGRGGGPIGGGGGPIGGGGGPIGGGRRGGPIGGGYRGHGGGYRGHGGGYRGHGGFRGNGYQWVGGSGGGSGWWPGYWWGPWGWAIPCVSHAECASGTCYAGYCAV